MPVSRTPMVTTRSRLDITSRAIATLPDLRIASRSTTKVSSAIAPSGARKYGAS
jgi:hypothetical protein